MIGSSVRVIKLGGSLLARAEWLPAFRCWLAGQPAMRNVLIAGGGVLADALRQLDRVHYLDPSDAHWLAIGAMSLTAQLVHRLLPEAAWTDDWLAVAEFAGVEQEFDRRDERLLLVFDPGKFLKAIEPTAGGNPLPHGWDVTSDSIAARVAALLNCRELVLLKSCLPATASTFPEAASAPYVDQCFSQFARTLPLVRFVNMSSGAFLEERFVMPQPINSISGSDGDPMEKSA